jgi:hypothetical protein
VQTLAGTKELHGRFRRENAPLANTRERLCLPVLFKLHREPQEASYQVCELSPYFGILHRHRFLAKQPSQLSTLCARVHGLGPTKESLSRCPSMSGTDLNLIWNELRGS